MRYHLEVFMLFVSGGYGVPQSAARTAQPVNSRAHRSTDTQASLGDDPAASPKRVPPSLLPTNLKAHVQTLGHRE